MNRTYKKIITLTSLVATMWLGVGCEQTLDVNIDPNKTVTNPPNLILTSVQAQLGFSMGADLNRYTALFVMVSLYNIYLSSKTLLG